ncbi:MAG: hypothetical protein JO317_03430 [Verrucomicrobiae bacterium]|nr:hypothetical protein [Verrucomicrobiae bacterium]
MAHVKTSDVVHAAGSLNPADVQKLERWSEVPPFKSESEEADFWMKHEIAPALMAHSLSVADQSESTSVSIRFDPRMLARLKRLARSRYLNYQSMVKQWLAERLEQELRNSGGGR